MSIRNIGTGRTGDRDSSRRVNQERHDGAVRRRRGGWGHRARQPAAVQRRGIEGENHCWRSSLRCRLRRSSSTASTGVGRLLPSILVGAEPATAVILGPIAAVFVVVTLTALLSLSGLNGRFPRTRPPGGAPVQRRGSRSTS